MPTFLCATCGTRFPESVEPPAACPVCRDARQYVPTSGQRWLDPVELASTHRNRIERHEADLYGIGTEPAFAIGQRALLVRTPEGNLLWDCISLLDADTVAHVRELGGVRAIAISHPHYYSSMRAWADAFGAEVLLHEADGEWVMDPGPEVRSWSGERHELFGGLSLARAGGHFPGATIAHWPGGAGGRGVLLTGDVLQVVPDRGVVSFMYSYPNLLPLPAATVRRVADTALAFDFDRIYGAWWDRVVPSRAAEAVRRGRDRYLAALAGELPGQDEVPAEGRTTPAAALAALRAAGDGPFVRVFRHGSLEVEYYRPERVDRQQPHTRDEIYVVASGTGTFVNGETRRPFEPGEVLFVPAGVEHRFEDFSDDFATWVFFYGPEGGERDGG